MKMAENNKGGILNKTEKFLRRRKTKVLQSLGKTGKTTDEQIEEDSQKLDKQQEIANKFQKDLRHYIHSARALALASKTFYSTLSETYEADWEGHSQVNEILQSVDILWQDYLQKLQEQVQDPLTKYLAVIPQIKARVAKRGRKLIDYDNARHNLEVQQNAKKKDDAKVAKAQEDLDQAKKIYDELNNELHTELPEFYNSRVTFYGNAFQHMFEAEQVFHHEISKGAERVAVVGEKLSADHESCTYTPRKNVRHTISQGSDEHMPNGHSENGNSGYESPQPESPGPSSTPSKAPEPAPRKAPEPESPEPSPAPSPVKADVVVDGIDKEADTSKDSVEDDKLDYENADLSQQASRQSAEVQEVKVTVNETATEEQVTIATASSGSDIVQSTASITVAKIDQPIIGNETIANEKVANIKSANENVAYESSQGENKDIANAVKEIVDEDVSVKSDERKISITAEKELTDIENAVANEVSVEDQKVQKEAEVIKANIQETFAVQKAEVQEIESESKISDAGSEMTLVEEKTEKSDVDKPKEEPKVNGVDTDSSIDQDIPDHAPPPPPMSEPPTQLQESPRDDMKDAGNDEHDDVDGADGLYQVPPPAKPIDDLPPKYVKTVIATHPYKGEDDDELSFETGEVIYVVEYDDPEEQDEGWLMGIRKSENQKGVFPANFTKCV